MSHHDGVPDTGRGSFGTKRCQAPKKSRRSRVKFTPVWVNREDREEPLAAAPGYYSHPDVSPEGERIAVRMATGGGDIWINDLALDTWTRLTVDDLANDRLPRWSPDSQRVAFTSNRAGASNLFWKAADGSRVAERLATSPNQQFSSSWSSDGKQLLFHELNPDTVGGPVAPTTLPLTASAS